MARTVSIRGVPHSYELTAPTAVPDTLVFVHGWLLSRAYWQPVIAKLADTFQCLSYDLRGFGDSQPLSSSASSSVSPAANSPSANATPRNHGTTAVADPSKTLTLDSDESGSNYAPAVYAQDLHGLLHALNIQRAWLVGHSLGGSIALWAADQCPEAIAGVICVNSGGGIYLKEDFEKFRNAGQQLLKFRPQWLCHLPILEIPMTMMNVAQSIDRSWGRQRLLDLVNAEPAAALGTLLDSTTEDQVHRLPQVVARLAQPVHFIAGAEDRVMEPKYVKHLASFHPSFECCGNNVTEIPQCGHLSMVEQPDAVATHIRAILNQHSSLVG